MNADRSRTGGKFVVTSCGRGPVRHQAGWSYFGIVSRRVRPTVSRIVPEFWVGGFPWVVLEGWRGTGDGIRGKDISGVLTSTAIIGLDAPTKRFGQVSPHSSVTHVQGPPFV